MSDTPDYDLDDDLFDFAGVSLDGDDSEEGLEEDLADVLASFRESNAQESAPEPAPEDVADLVASSLEPGPAPEAPTTRRVVPAPAPKQASVVPVPPAEPAVDLLPSQRPARVSRGVVAVALSVTLLNSALAVVFLRRSPSHEEVRAVDAAPAHQEATPPQRAPEPDHDLPDPDLANRVRGHSALDEAREELVRGDYASCRQHAYSLLSVIDRFEDPRREEIEAECQFLIAQALHLEALARLGRTE